MLSARASLPLLIAILLVACSGSATSTASPINTPVAVATEAPTSVNTAVAVESEAPTPAVPLWRYVNSGWVSPGQRFGSGVFDQQFRASVITNQAELDAFQSGFIMKRTFGTTTSLGRVDFPKSILLAAYYLWRPYQGDPLSIVGFSLEDHRADVQLDLEESPQGKEYPYLFAPMIMVAVDRSHFPAGEAVEFVFHLNGVPQATIVATVD